MNRKSDIKQNFANKLINELVKNIHTKYNIDVQPFNEIVSGFGGTYTGVTGDFTMYVGSKMQTHGIIKHNTMIDFLKVICALYHEEQHVIQHCKTFYDKQPTDDAVMMAIRNLASENNRQYYQGLNRYNNDLSEIDAEAIAIANTYDYIQDNFPKENADKLICDLVNHKAQTANYFISGHYQSFDEILDAFSEHYEDAKTKQIEGYIAYALRPSQIINENYDECIKYLQTCVRDNPEEMTLLTQFNQEKDPHKKDLMIASITCHLHPEINYGKMYPCLIDVDLSPQNIFNRSLPTIQFPTEKIKEESINKRIQIATSIHDGIILREYGDYVNQLQTHAENLNEGLAIEQSKTNRTYEP